MTTKPSLREQITSQIKLYQNDIFCTCGDKTHIDGVGDDLLNQTLSEDIVAIVLQAIFPLPELSDEETAEAYRDYKQAKGYRDWWDINEARALSVAQAQLAKAKEHIEDKLK